MSPISLFRKPHKPTSAQGMVEFALTITIFLVLVLGIIEFGWLLAVYTSVYSASREAARYGAAVGMSGNGVTYDKDCAGIRAAAVRVGQIGRVQPANVEIRYQPALNNTAEFSTLPACPTATHLGDKIMVRVTGSYEPLVPLISIPTVNLSITTSRTIIKDVDIMGTPMPSPTPGPTDPGTATPTLTASPTPTPTDTPTITPSPTFTVSPTPTETFTLTPTVTFGPSPTPTSTDTPTPTPTATSTATPTFTPTITPSPTFDCGHIVVGQVNPSGDTKIFFTVYNDSPWPVTLDGIYPWWMEHGNGANVTSIVMEPATAPLSSTLWTGILYDAYLISNFNFNADLTIGSKQTKVITITYSNKKHTYDRVTLYFNNLCSRNTP